MQQDFPDADFVWTTRKSSDDMWLRRAIREVADKETFRVHRQISRQKEKSELNAMEEAPANDFLASTKVGRPNLNAFLSDIAQEMRPDSVLGIFFMLRLPWKMHSEKLQSAWKCGRASEMPIFAQT